MDVAHVRLVSGDRDEVGGVAATDAEAASTVDSRRCVVCGTPIRSKRAAKHCSGACRAHASRARRQAEAEAALERALVALEDLRRAVRAGDGGVRSSRVPGASEERVAGGGS
jgi:predicted nucleic acid-binding Zn ribbon protein